MKKVVIVLCILLTILTGFNAAYAAFPIKSASADTAIADKPTNETAAAESKPQVKHQSFFSKLRSGNTDDGAGSRSHGRQGWAGILALSFGIGVCILAAIPSALGFALLLAVGALIFGIIGMNRKRYKNFGMSLAGLIIGGAVILSVFVILAVFAMVGF